METITMSGNKIKFVCKAVRWFDRVNGNTYHSVRITRTSDKAILGHEWTYGYGDAYKQTALKTMDKFGWLPKEYSGDKSWLFERENGYPIEWVVMDGLKRDMIANGRLTVK